MASASSTSGDPDKDQAQFIALMNGRSHKEEVKKLQENVSSLVDAAREYTKSGSVGSGTKFASSLTHFCEKSDSDLDKAVQRVSETIITLENMRHALLQSLESEFVNPFDNFLKGELKAISEYERKLNKAREDYDISQTKYEQVRKKKAGAEKNKAEQELLDYKHAFEVAELSYLNKLVELDAKKQYELSDRLLNFVISKANYYKQAHEMLKQMEPFLQDAKTKVVQSRKDLSEQMTQMTPEKIEDFLSKRFASSDVTTKQGYLLLKGKRRWLTVQNGHLEVYKSWKDLNSGQPPTKALDMMLCSVKLDADAKEKFTFTLTSNEDKVLPLQAMNQQDLDEWILVLKNSIALRLKRQHSNVTLARSVGDGTSASPEEEKKKPYNTMRSLSQANCFCADCGKRDPDWAAYNLGVIICFECSGVHRSLGTHVSRVRSLTLDKWDPDTFFLLRQFGNQKANEIWEASLASSKNPDDKKPPESCDRPTREKYIKAKYVQRKFVTRFGGDQLQSDAALNSAALSNDYHAMLRLFAQSADPNATNDLGQNLLIQAIIDGRVTTYTIEFLIQNGAKLINADNKGWTALHYCAMLDRVTFAKVLMRCGGDANVKDKEGKTPIDVAQQSQSKNVHKFLTSGEYTEPAAASVTATNSGSPAQQISASQSGHAIANVVGAAEREKLQQYRETMGAAIEGLKVSILHLRGEIADCRDEQLLIDVVKRVRLIKQNLYEVPLDQSTLT